MTNFKKTVWALGFLCLGVSHTLGMEFQDDTKPLGGNTGSSKHLTKKEEKEFYLYGSNKKKTIDLSKYLKVKGVEGKTALFVLADDVNAGKFSQEQIEGLKTFSKTACNLFVLCQNKSQSMEAQKKFTLFSKGFNYYHEARYLDFLFPSSVIHGDQDLKLNSNPVSLISNSKTLKGFEGLFPVLLDKGILTKEFRLLSSEPQEGLYWILNGGLKEETGATLEKKEKALPSKENKKEEKKPEEQKKEELPPKSNQLSGGSIIEGNKAGGQAPLKFKHLFAGKCNFLAPGQTLFDFLKEQ